MKFLRLRAFATGAALILATNVVVLGGVAYNRSGEPESTLKLTQRELALPYAWGLTKENSGLALRIVWRTVAPELDRSVTNQISYYGMSQNPYWLNEAKLRELGFDASKLRRVSEDKPRRDRPPSREVYLVLELDGLEYQKLLERARSDAAAAQSRLSLRPEDPTLQQQAKTANDALRREEQENSRLVAIDAGLDPEALREAHPDRSRYAIVRGRVQPDTWSDAKQVARGRIVDFSVIDLNVPASLRDVVGNARPPSKWGTESTSSTYEATVSYGRRLEPWIVGAAKAARSK